MTSKDLYMINAADLTRHSCFHRKLVDFQFGHLDIVAHSLSSLSSFAPQPS